MENMLNEAQMYMWHRIQSADKTCQDEKFALYVRLSRVKQGISQGQLAKQVDITTAMLSAVEMGIIAFEEITPVTFAALESALGISYLSFLKYNQDVIDELVESHSDGEDAVSAGQPFSSSNVNLDFYEYDEEEKFLLHRGRTLQYPHTPTVAINKTV